MSKHIKVMKLFGLSKGEILNKIKEKGFAVDGFIVRETALDAEIIILDSEDNCFEKAEAIRKLFKKYCYSTSGQTLAEAVAEKLFEKKKVLSVAESLTGGLVAAKLIEVSGISKYFREGIVSYANEAKISRLGVKEETLKKFGAVSSQTACEMADGLIAEGAEIGISTTGIAGPTGGSAEKPVGLVYFGFAGNGKTYSERQIFCGNRKEIRNKSTNYALFNLFLLICAIK